MDNLHPLIQEQLDRILALDPSALGDGDKDFLRARIDYLTEEHKAKFAEILPRPVVPEVLTPDARDEAPEEFTPLETDADGVPVKKKTKKS
jgi:hypothetical protein